LYEKLSPEQLQVALKHPVAFVPAGINEWHAAAYLRPIARRRRRCAAWRSGSARPPMIGQGRRLDTVRSGRSTRGTLTIDKDLYLAAADELLTH
jgi:hypothetical protein